MKRENIKYLDISAVPDEYLAHDILPNRSGDDANIIAFSDVVYLLNFFYSRYRMKAGILIGTYDLGGSPRTITEYKTLNMYNLRDWFSLFFYKSQFLTSESLPPTKQTMSYDEYKSYYGVGASRPSLLYKFPTDNKLLQKGKIQDVYDWACENLLPLQRGYYKSSVSYTYPTEWIIVSANEKFVPPDNVYAPIGYYKVFNEQDETAYDPTEYNGEAYCFGTFENVDISVVEPASSSLETTFFLGWRAQTNGSSMIDGTTDARYFYTDYALGDNITNYLSAVLEFVKSHAGPYVSSSYTSHAIHFYVHLEGVFVFYKTKLTTIP